MAEAFNMHLTLNHSCRPLIIPFLQKLRVTTLFSTSWKYLNQYLNHYKLLSSCQSGFRSLHSTLTALLEATNSWSGNIDNAFLNDVDFIDHKKSFDTIDHEIILRKMSYFGADQATITRFQSYLSNRTQRCNVNGRLSTPRTITCGAPQGSILGLLLLTQDDTLLSTLTIQKL